MNFYESLSKLLAEAPDGLQGEALKIMLINGGGFGVCSCGRRAHIEEMIDELSENNSDIKYVNFKKGKMGDHVKWNDNW